MTKKDIETTNVRVCPSGDGGVDASSGVDGIRAGATVSTPELSTPMMKCFSRPTDTTAALSGLELGLGIAQTATEYGMEASWSPQVVASALELLENGMSMDHGVPRMPSDNVYDCLNVTVRAGITH